MFTWKFRPKKISRRDIDRIICLVNVNSSSEVFVSFVNHCIISRDRGSRRHKTTAKTTSVFNQSLFNFMCLHLRCCISPLCPREKAVFFFRKDSGHSFQYQPNISTLNIHPVAPNGIQYLLQWPTIN